MELAPNTKVSRIVLQEGQLVILVSEPYNGGINMNYFVTNATNFAGYLWPEIGKIVT